MSMNNTRVVNTTLKKFSLKNSGDEDTSKGRYNQHMTINED